MKTTNYLLGLIALLLATIAGELYLSMPRSPLSATNEATGDTTNVRIVAIKKPETTSPDWRKEWSFLPISGSVQVDGWVSILNTVDVDVNNWP